MVPVTPDARCFNGVFTGGTEGFITVGVDDTTAGYESSWTTARSPDAAESSHSPCSTATAPRPSVPAPLPADPGPDGTCADLGLTFTHAGGYPIEIDVAPDTLPGDFSLRFY